MLVEETSPFLSDPEILSDFLKTSSVVGPATVFITADISTMEALENIEIESVSIKPIEEEL